MNTEPPYTGLKWAHFLRVMLLVPLDQGTQGNKGRKGISLPDKPIQNKLLLLLLLFGVNLEDELAIMNGENAVVLELASKRLRIKHNRKVQ